MSDTFRILHEGREPQRCPHVAERQYAFNVPYLGVVLVCRPCRAELAKRTIKRPLGLMPIDMGRIGYQCKACGGTYTSDDAMTCTCPNRKAECDHMKRIFAQWRVYNDLVSAR